ncbi:MAG: acylphosphatase [Bacteroidales bacterium]|nr:acylphosphatase [Bacteroidales bacterium]
MKLKAKTILLYGKVQQVGFRYYVYRLACELGVNGYVKNMPDGSVFIEAECEEHTMDIFIEHCKKGSPYSNVSSCEITQNEIKNYTNFRIC